MGQCGSRICIRSETIDQEIRLAAQTSNPTFPWSLKPLSFSESTAMNGKEERVLGLKVLCSTSLPYKSMLRIEPLGYDHSKRGARDGITFFGCKKRGNGKDTERGEVLNDVVIKIPDRELAGKHRGRHFEIAYRNDTRSYWIHDLGIGFGAFLRLNSATRLKDNSFISIGDSFAVTKLEETPERSQLKIKLFGDPCKGESYYFSAENYEYSYIRIGRESSCQVMIDDYLISKCHASIWRDEGGWMLADGDVEQHTPSTNGTW